MKANYGKIVVGVIIGIMAALTLTLNVWGVEWYKIVISTVAGVIIGMLVSDYRVTVTIFKTGFQTAANNSWRRAERIKNGEVSKEQQHEFDISIIKGLYVLLIVFFMAIMAGILISIIYGFNLIKLDEGRYILLTLAVAAILIRYYILIICALEFNNWVKKLNKFQVQKIWNKEPSKHGKNSLNYDYVKNVEIGFMELTTDMSFKEIMYRVLASFKALVKYDLIGDWNGLKAFCNVVIVILLALTLFITTGLPVLPVWIIKETSKHGHLLSVAASITIGSITGSLAHSQLIGLGSGLGFLAISYLIEKIFKEIDPVYLFRKDRLFDKIATKLAESMP
ncbi:MAG: hypothetical protein WAW11_05320 [Patescibacteria group bacterium]